MNQDIEFDLRNETMKWLQRAEQLFPKISHKEDRFTENIAAYISDSHHFLDNGDLIRAFEAVIWAWAWMEIGQEMGLLAEDE
jgi:uncharacterized protein